MTKKTNTLLSFAHTDMRKKVAFAGALALILLSSIPGRSIAATMTDAAPVTRAIGRYDAFISRAAIAYHKSIADARRKFDHEKNKADALYDKATEKANRTVTYNISMIKEQVAQAQGFDANLKDKIKGAAQNFAVSIAKARAIHQAALAASLKEYTATLRTVTGTYADAIKKAEGTYRAEAMHWIQ